MKKKRYLLFLVPHLQIARTPRVPPSRSSRWCHLTFFYLSFVSFSFFYFIFFLSFSNREKEREREREPAVFGTTSAKTSNTMRPAFAEPTLISYPTFFFFLFSFFLLYIYIYIRERERERER